MIKIEGIITSLLTPLDERERIADEPFRRIIDFQLSRGIHGFFVMGTAGEGMKLPAEKRKRGAEVVIEHTRSRVPVVVHVGTQDTESTVELAKHAEDAGADAVAAVGPFYYRPDTLGLIKHYRRIVDSVDLPVLVYNNSARQGYNIGPPTYGELKSAVPEIAGIKDTSYNIEQLQELLQKFGENDHIIGAGDTLILPTFTVGAAAHISMASNVFPEMAVQIYQVIRNGDIESARRIQRQLNTALDALKHGPEIASYKEALRIRGIDLGHVSSPLREPTPEEASKLRTRLTELELVSSVS